MTVGADDLDAFEFTSLFDKLRTKDVEEVVKRKQRALLVVTRRWISNAPLTIGERVLARFQDGSEWYAGSVAATPPPDADGSDGGGSSGLFDIQYDDGDYEQLPRERVLRQVGEVGRWAYSVVGPGDNKAEEAALQHPWWPTSEQFVDFVAAKGTADEVAAEVRRLRQTAAQTYTARESARPWPLEAKAAAKAAGEDTALLLREADEHRQRLSADITNPAHRDDLIFMFRQLGVLFLQMVDSELHSSYLLPEMPLADAANGAGCAEIERAWLRAPLAEIMEGTRQKCDVCETSILDRHWACTVEGCEWEACMTCHWQGQRRRMARRLRAGGGANANLGAAARALVAPVPRVRGPGAARRAERPLESGGLPSRPKAEARERRPAYEGNESSLQARIGASFPDVVNTAGEVWHEFKAVIPTEGKYAGHPCAVCMVAGCPMMGKVFHSKNVATHGRPRAPGYRTSVFSRAHDNACEAFIALFTAGAASAEEVGKTVELQLPPPKPPPPPVPLEASEDDDDDAGPAAQSRRRRRQNCAACQGKHRAHTCGRKFQKGSKPSGPRKPRVHKPPSGDAPPLLVPPLVAVQRPLSRILRRVRARFGRRLRAAAAALRRRCRRRRRLAVELPLLRLL